MSEEEDMLTGENKLAMIEAARGPLEGEQYQAEIELELAQKSEDERLTEEPQARLDMLQEKMDVLDGKQKEAEAQAKEEAAAEGGS